MNDFDLLIQLHITQLRQGPGGKDETLLAASLAGLNPTQPLVMADIGCGTGASTLELVKHFNCSIQAVDFFPDVIEALKSRATQEMVINKITPIVGNMEDLPFEEESFDVLWSEGAIYNMGFEKGISEWRKYLKPGGKLVVSELTWLTEKRPEEITRHWANEYPEVATAATKMAQLEKHGYKLLGYFPLGIHCWLENYYQPLQTRFVPFMAEHLDQPDAVKALIEEHQLEIDLYEKYKDFVSYGFYIAEKV